MIGQINMPDHKKQTVAVIFGGRSAEHDVSIITAHIPIIESLKAAGKYEILPIYIAKDGSWYAEAGMDDLAYFKNPQYEEKLKSAKKLQLQFDDGLVLQWPGLLGKSTKVDVVFSAMHGTYGEDGSLMGLLRMAGVPFVGCGLSASAVAMDKVLTKQVLTAENIPVTPYVWFTRYDWQNKQAELEQAIEKLNYPLFVKPVHLGSSIAISKVKEPEDLLDAIEVALHYDDKVLVEEGVEDLIEVTLPIMGNDELQLACLERPLNETELFDFSDKYLAGGQKGSEAGVNSQYSEVPAQIDEALADVAKDYAQQTYRTLGCSGIARIDLLINAATSEVFVNEVNTLPGSLYHHNWKKAGVSNVELVTKLIDLAFDRVAHEAKIAYTFDSEILQKVGGPKQQD